LRAIFDYPERPLIPLEEELTVVSAYLFRAEESLETVRPDLGQLAAR
jgi:hypothetical protein